MIIPLFMQPIVSAKQFRKGAAAAVCVFLFAGITATLFHPDRVKYHNNRRLLLEVEANNFVEVQRLLALGADPNTTGEEIDSSDEDGSPWDSLMAKKYLHSEALILAARNGNLPMVKLLLQFGAKVNLGAGCGHSELDYAEEKCLTEMISLLKQRGSKKNRVDICL